MSLALLLDTHALLWWTHQPGSLSSRASEAIADPANDVFVSPVSAMEIATKRRKRKLAFDSLLASDFVAQIAIDAFREVPITAEHAQLAGNLGSAHRDPWDRLLAAQAQIEGFRLVTRDRTMPGLGAETFW